jgi:hypothetical protein
MTMPFLHHPFAQPASRAGRAAYRRDSRWDKRTRRLLDITNDICVVAMLLLLGWTLTDWTMALLAAGG